MPLSVTQKITLDTLKVNILDAVIAKQFDAASRYLNVTITEQGEVYTVPSTATVLINCLRPDETSASFEGVAESDGTVTVPVPAWALQQDGTVHCDITVADGESILKTTLFDIEVQYAANPDDAISDVEYTVWQNILTRAAEAQESASAAAASAAEAALTLENAAENLQTATEVIEQVKAAVELMPVRFSVTSAGLLHVELNS